METLNLIQKLKEENRLMYHYVRGSTLYGTAIEGKSDIDTSGVFISDPKQYLGLSLGYKDYIADEKSDNTLYELLKWTKGLITSNPTMLESLFIPQKYILYKKDFLDPFFENKNLFLTKQIYYPFVGFVISQIEKARGLNKKIVNPIHERKDILDFCYVPYRQGSINIKAWLEMNGLEQKYCGVTNVPNMPNSHHLYYDWSRHFKEKNIKPIDLLVCRSEELMPLASFLVYTYGTIFDEKWFAKQLCTQRDYHGILDDDLTSNQLRLSSIAKRDHPLVTFTYNQNAYSQHCRHYKEYKIWEKERNKERYESTLDKTYDGKNLSHCFRILTIAQEILDGQGMILDRREVGDAQFLIDIRNHKFEYDELIQEVERRKANLKNLLEKSQLNEKIDINMVNDIVKDIQLNFIRKLY